MDRQLQQFNGIWKDADMSNYTTTGPRHPEAMTRMFGQPRKSLEQVDLETVAEAIEGEGVKRADVSRFLAEDLEHVMESIEEHTSWLDEQPEARSAYRRLLVRQIAALISQPI